MESEDDSSETETQFVEHPDDATSMWTVIEILDERPHEFLIKWAGLDSEGKPWADSWEPKGNVTNDVVHAWREEHPRVSSSISSSRKKSKSKSKSKSATASVKARSNTPAKKRTSRAIIPGSDSPPPVAGPSRVSSKKRKHVPEPETFEEETSASTKVPKKKKRKTTKLEPTEEDIPKKRRKDIGKGEAVEETSSRLPKISHRAYVAIESPNRSKKISQVDDPIQKSLTVSAKKRAKHLSSSEDEHYELEEKLDRVTEDEMDDFSNWYEHTTNPLTHPKAALVGDAEVALVKKKHRNVASKPAVSQPDDEENEEKQLRAAAVSDGEEEIAPMKVKRPKAPAAAPRPDDEAATAGEDEEVMAARKKKLRKAPAAARRPDGEEKEGQPLPKAAVAGEDREVMAARKKKRPKVPAAVPRPDGGEKRKQLLPKVDAVGEDEKGMTVMKKMKKKRAVVTPESEDGELVGETAVVLSEPEDGEFVEKTAVPAMAKRPSNPLLARSSFVLNPDSPLAMGANAPALMDPQLSLSSRKALAARESRSHSLPPMLESYQLPATPPVRETTTRRSPITPVHPPELPAMPSRSPSVLSRSKQIDLELPHTPPRSLTPPYEPELSPDAILRLKEFDDYFALHPLDDPPPRASSQPDNELQHPAPIPAHPEAVPITNSQLSGDSSIVPETEQGSSQTEPVVLPIQPEESELDPPARSPIRSGMKGRSSKSKGRDQELNGHVNGKATSPLPPTNVAEVHDHLESPPASTSREGSSKATTKQKQKKLTPIPVFSPSSFLPYLPSARNGNGGGHISINDTIDQWPSPDKATRTTITHSFDAPDPGTVADPNLDMNPDVSMDDISMSIDNGPEPQSQLGTQAQSTLRNPTFHRLHAISASQDSEKLGKHIHTRGLELAEERKRRLRLELGYEDPEGKKKKRLDELIGGNRGVEQHLKEVREQQREEDRNDYEEEAEHNAGFINSAAELSNNLGDLINANGNAVDAARTPEVDDDEDELLYPNDPSVEFRSKDISGGNDAVARAEGDSVFQTDMVPKQSLPSTDKQEAAPSEMDADALRALVERLFQENHSLQLQVVELKDNSSSDIRAKLAELEQQNLTLTQELTSALASKGELEQQNLTLSQDLASARISKASAEKDSEFLRTQYTTASGYASEVGAENASLQQRVEIAERQAAEGVALIKASFEERLRVSEEQTRSFAKIADFMMKKDTATDNIRQQAAEAPELKARCEKLEEQIQRLEGEIEIEQLKVEALEQEKEAIEMELKEVVDKGKGDSAESRRQIAQLMVDLNETKAAQHQNASSERVFRCEWRLADSSPCMFICPTVKELEDHTIHGHIDEL